MKVDQQLVDKITSLSKLQFNDEQKAAMMNDMTRMIDFVEKLNEVDTEGVEPLIYVSEEVNALRKDVVETPITKEEGLMNAPMKDSDYIKVPKVLDRSAE